MDSEIKETLRGQLAGRTNALAELDKEKEKGTKLEEERKGEEEGDRLKEETASQLKAWQEKEKKWEDGIADDKKRHQEAVDGLTMGQERELESWRWEVEGLKEETKEAFGANVKNIFEWMKKEKEAWKKEKEVWKKEKEKMAREMKELEENREGGKKPSKEATDRAQMRLAELEEQKEKLKIEAANMQIKSEEAEAARQTAEEEEEDSKDGAQKDAKRAVARLEEEIFNGRKLIEDFYADKRRDRQLLLELRAQLV